MGLLKRFFAQTRKPEGILGKLMVNGMNGGHAGLADWGMEMLSGIKASCIADLGCGGGRNAGELLKGYPEAKVAALDYSEVSVAKAKKYNKKAIAEDRCRVVRGSVSELPFRSETLDLATAFETVYFWPALEDCFREVCRTLKPGGAFLICNESDGTDETSLRFEKIIDGMKCYTAGQLTDALRAAGFSEARSAHHPGKPWIRVLAIK